MNSQGESAQPRTASSLSADLVAAAVHAANQFVLLIERCGDRPADIFIRGANAAVQTATAYGRAELQDSPLTILVTAPAVPPELLGALRAGSAERTEMLCQRRDGQPFWLGLHLVPMPQAGPNHFVMLGRDITRSRREEAQVHAVSGLLAKVFSAIEAGLVIVDAKGGILLANPYIHRLLRMPSEAMVGRNARDFVLGADRARLAEARDRQFVEGGNYTLPATLVAADGTEVTVSLTASVIVVENLPHCRLLTINPSDHTVTKPPPLRVQIAGKVQLVGLEEVKAALGAKWPEHASRAMATAEHVLSKRCGQQDMYARSGDASFVVRFADGTEEDAAFRAATIAREIRQRLIGNGDSEAASHVTAVTASVPIPHPEPPPAALNNMLAEELTRRTDEVEKTARAYLAPAAVWQDGSLFEPVHARLADPPVARIFKLAPPYERRITTALASLPKAEAAAFSLDAVLVKLVAAELARLPAEASQIPILVDVRFDVLASQARADRYLIAYQQIDPRLRQMLTLVLIDIPPHIHATRLLDCAMRLRGYAGGLGFLTETLSLPFADLSFSSASFSRHSIVVVPGEANGLSATVLPKLRRLIPSIHAYRERLLVRGVGNWAAADSLLAAGIDMVSLTGA